MNITYFYTGVMGLAIVAILSCFITTIKKQGKLASSLRRLMIAALLTIVFEGLYVYAPSHHEARAWMCMFSLSIDWVLLMLYSYTRFYTDTEYRVRPLVGLLHLLATIDSISLIINARTGHVFVLNERYFDKFGDTFYYMDTESAYYTAHLVFCYGISILVFALLLQKTIQTSSFYRKKYTLIMISFVGVLALDGLTLIVGLPYNSSVILYGIMSIVVTYFSLSYIPRTLVGNMLSLVINDLNNSVVCFDQHGKIVYANDSAGALATSTGRADHIMQRYRDWKELYNKDDEVRSRWQEKYEIEGVTRFFDVDAHKLYDDNQRFIGVYFVSYDRTEDESRHLKQLNDAKENAARQSKFWSTVSNEMRTPVNAIIDLNEKIMREADGDEVLGYAQEINSSTKELVELIGDVLEYSKVSSGDITVMADEYQVSNLIQKIQSVVVPEAKGKNVDLKVEVDPYLPKSLLGDEALIQQVITRLLISSMRYIEEGNLLLRLFGERRFDDFYLHVEIEINTTQVVLMYDHPEDAQGARELGSSIGFSICENILRQMDSSLKVDNTELSKCRLDFCVVQPSMSHEFVGNFEEGH